MPNFLLKKNKQTCSFIWYSRVVTSSNIPFINNMKKPAFASKRDVLELMTLRYITFVRPYLSKRKMILPLCTMFNVCSVLECPCSIPIFSHVLFISLWRLNSHWAQIAERAYVSITIGWFWCSIKVLMGFESHA